MLDHRKHKCMEYRSLELVKKDFSARKNLLTQDGNIQLSS